MGKKKNKYKRRRANNLNLHTRVRIVRIITWNSGADNKKSPVFKWSVTAAAQALDRLCSFSRQQGSQERYQSARPPCEMSSLSRGLWDCCHHPNSLWMSASLTGQLDDAAPHHRQQTHFQLSSFIPSYFFHFFFTHFSTAPLSGRTDDKGNSPKTIHTKLVWQIQSVRKTHIKS